MKKRTKREHTPVIVAGILFLAIIASFFLSQLSRKDLIHLNRVMGPCATNQKDAHAAFSQQVRLYLDAYFAEDIQLIQEAENSTITCRRKLIEISENPKIPISIRNDAAKLQSNHTSYTAEAKTTYSQWANGIQPDNRVSTALARQQEKLDKQFTQLEQAISAHLIQGLEQVGKLDTVSLIAEMIIILVAVLSVFILLRKIVTKPLERLVEERTRQLREHEIDLMASENRFRQLVEHMTNGVFICEYSEDLDDFLFKEANRSVGSMEQIPRDEVIGRPLTQVFPQIRSTSYFQALQEVYTTGEPQVLDAYYYSNERISGWRESVIYRLHTGEVVTVYNDVTEKKVYEKRLEQMNRDLQQASLHAGMAEIASGVLHNVGNTLNSVQVLSQTILERMKAFPIDGLKNTAKLLENEKDNLPDFLLSERGRVLPNYFSNLHQAVLFEKDFLINELTNLLHQVDHMGGVVHSQQDYAKQVAVEQKVGVDEIINDALKLNEASLQRHKIRVAYNLTKNFELYIQLHKVLQVLVNLIRNAKDAMRELPIGNRQLYINAWLQDDDTVCISVKDNGVGISQENQKRIFSHGFTTRSEKGGHGFGLHSCALVMKQIKGELKVESDGEGKGACFTLHLPIRPEHVSNQLQESTASSD